MRRLLMNFERLLPALVMAAGVTLLTAGILAFAPSGSGSAVATPPAAGDPRLGGEQSSAPIAPTASPIEISSSPPETPAPEPGERTFATRIKVPALGIDLPVVTGDLALPGNTDDYPPCDVALYLPEFAQPGEPGTTYVYAHAQRGMFLPLLRASEINDGAQLIGRLIEVYTSADEMHLYEIVRVKRHATDLSLAYEAGDDEQLILQTSEGPAGTVPKLQVAARPVSVTRAATTEAQPSPQPRVCLPGG